MLGKCAQEKHSGEVYVILRTIGGNHRLGAELMNMENSLWNSGLACKGQRRELLTVCCGVVGVREQLVRLENSHSREGGGHWPLPSVGTKSPVSLLSWDEFLDHCKAPCPLQEKLWDLQCWRRRVKRQTRAPVHARPFIWGIGIEICA